MSEIDLNFILMNTLSRDTISRDKMDHDSNLDQMGGSDVKSKWAG